MSEGLNPKLFRYQSGLELYIHKDHYSYLVNLQSLLSRVFQCVTFDCSSSFRDTRELLLYCYTVVHKYKPLLACDKAFDMIKIYNKI